MVRITSLTLLAGGALLLCLMLSTATARPAPDDGSAAAAREALRAAAPVLSDATGEIDRLTARLRDLPVYERPTRNPFQFKQRVATPRPAAPAVPSVAAIPPLPRLVAILADQLNGQLVRRAAISEGGAIRVVAVGDTVGALRVEKVTADAIELVDPATRATFRVSLR